MILSDIRMRDLREGFKADWRITEEHHVERLTEFGSEEHTCFNYYVIELSIDDEPRFGASAATLKSAREHFANMFESWLRFGRPE